MPGYQPSGWSHKDKIDWGNVKVGGGKVAHPGLYEIKAADLKMKQSSTGKPMIEAKFEIVGTDEDELKDSIGCFVYDNWMLSEEGGFRMKGFAMVAGLLDDLPESQAPDDVSAFCEKAMGTSLPAMIKHDMYNGQAKAKIDFFGEERPKDEEPEEEDRGKKASKSSSKGGSSSGKNGRR